MKPINFEKGDKLLIMDEISQCERQSTRDDDLREVGGADDCALGEPKGILTY
jgi:hypothetical protein